MKMGVMLRPTMLPLCLIAALLGTPLRQVEAADDLARSFAELGQGPVVEMSDGGVGDDPEASILNAGGATFSFPATSCLAMADVSYPSTVPPLVVDHRDDGTRGELAGHFPVCSTRRLAQLQCFLL